MAIPIAQLFTAIAQSDLLTSLYSIASSLGLPVTAWQSGQPSRTLISLFSYQGNSFSQQIAAIVAGGFLDYAASVTDDPSVIPGAQPGWLDALACGINVTNGQGGTGRIPATYAPGYLTFVNANNSSAGTYAAGTLHALNPVSGATYSNVASVTISTGTTTAAFKADVAGAAGTSGPGFISALITPIIGVTVSNGASFVGAPAESNAALVARCRAKYGSLSPNGPKQAYDYFAKTIPPPNPLLPLTSGLLTSPGNPVRATVAVANEGSGTLDLYVGGVNGPYVAPNAYIGSANETITSVSAANPAVVTITGGAHGYSSGDNIYISGTGNAAIDNQTWSITVTGAGTFTIPVANTPLRSGGIAYRQSDLDLIDKTIRAYVVPIGYAYETIPAPGQTIGGAGTIYLRRGSGVTTAQAQNAAAAALAAYFNTLPLGGDNLGAGSQQLFLREPMQAAIQATLPNDILNVALTLSGGTLTINGDVVAASAQSEAVLGVMTFNVVPEL